MSLHDILTKSVQVVKEVLDLEPDIEPPSLVSQFVAIKHQLAEVQERLNESHRIAREKDVAIGKLQKAMAAKVQPRPTAPAFVRHEEAFSRATPAREHGQATQVGARESVADRAYTPEQARVLQAESAEELKLPAVPCYQAPTPKARPIRTPVVAPTASPAQAEKARPTRTRVVAKKTSRATQAAAQPKKSAPATPEKAKPTRKRVAAKKTATKAKTTAKATVKPKRKRASRARKS